MENSRNRLDELLHEKISFSSLSKKNTQKQLSDSPKIVILSWADGGGAGVAAYRVFCALRLIGANVSMLVMMKETNDPDVKIIPVDYAGEIDCSLSTSKRTREKVSRNFARWRNIQKNYSNHNPEISFFTDGIAETELFNIKEIRDADVINIHWVAGVVNYEDMAISFGGKPLFWTLHDMNPFTGGCHYTGGCKQYQTHCGNCPQLRSGSEMDLTRYYFELKKSAIENRNLHIITPSSWLTNEAKNSTMLKKFPAHVVHNTLPTSIYTPPTEQKSIRRKLGIPENSFVILTGAVELCDVRKGFRYVLDSFQKLANEQFERPITLALYGKLDTNIDIPSQFNVVKLGYIDGNQAMAEAYCSADLFMITSLEDNLPNVVIESMACGTPVLGFDTGGIPDMIVHKKTGYLVKQKDTTALAEGVKWAYSCSQTQYKLLRNSCRDWIMKTFSQPVIAQQYLNLFTKEWNAVKDSEEVILEISKMDTPQEVVEKFEKSFALSEYSPKVLLEAIRFFAKQNDATYADQLLIKLFAMFPFDNELLKESAKLLTNSSRTVWLSTCSQLVDLRFEDKELRLLFAKQREKECEYLLELAEIVSDETTSVETISTDPLLSVLIPYDEDQSALEQSLVSIYQNYPEQMVEIILLPLSAEVATQIDKPKEWSNISLNQIAFSDDILMTQRLNCGAYLASAPLIQFLNSGDLTIGYDLQISLFSSVLKPAVVFGDIIIPSKTVNNIALQTEKRDGLTLFRPGICNFNSLKESYGVGPIPIIKRDSFLSIGMFDSGFDSSMQHLFLRIARTDNIVYTPSTVGEILTTEERIYSKLKQELSLKKRFCNLYSEGSRAERLSDIRSFHLNPEKGASDFLNLVATLVEQKKFKEALSLYDRVYANIYQIQDETKFNEIIASIRKKISNSKYQN